MPPKKGAAKTTSKTSSKTTSKPKNTTAAKPGETKTKAATTAAAEKTKPEEPKVPQQVETISLKEVGSIVRPDADTKIAKSEKWPLIVDTAGPVGTFLRHRDVNYLMALDQGDMAPERIRMALLGALRFGKPLVLDMMEADLFEASSNKFDEVQKGLMDMVLDKSILQEENYSKLIKDEDGQDYNVSSFTRVGDFQFIILTTFESPPSSLVDRTYLFRVE